jgi:hypothetical protein
MTTLDLLKDLLAHSEQMYRKAAPGTRQLQDQLAKSEARSEQPKKRRFLGGFRQKQRA